MIALRLNAVRHPVLPETLPAPVAGPRQAVVRLKAAALNHRDVFIQKGLYPAIKTPLTMGSDGAGVVESVGSPADAHWLGRQVVICPNLEWGASERAQGPGYHILGMPMDGTFAEQVVVPVAALHLKPGHLSWEQAAALPLAGLTAWRALYARADAEPRGRTLITGIGGGVALMGLQLEVAKANQVWVTSSSEAKLAKALNLGAKGGENYTHEGWAKRLLEATGGFNLVLDSAGGPQFGDLVKLCTYGACISFYGGTVGKWPELSPQLLFWKQITLAGSTMGSEADFANMLAFISEHKTTPIIDKVFPLIEAEQALRYLDAGGQFGKIVLSMGG